MTEHRRIIGALVAGLGAIASIGSLTLSGNSARQSVNGTIWVANRGDHTIQGFDADTRSVVHIVAMSPAIQPGTIRYGCLPATRAVSSVPDRRERDEARQNSHIRVHVRCGVIGLWSDRQWHNADRQFGTGNLAWPASPQGLLHGTRFRRQLVVELRQAQWRTRANQHARRVQLSVPQSARCRRRTKR